MTPGRRRTVLIALICGGVLCVVGGIGAWYLRSGASSPRVPVSSATRLGEAQVAELLRAGPSPLTFEPYQGQRRCCDLGDPTLSLHADGTLVIDAHGFALDERVANFRITGDGTIEITPGDSRLEAWLKEKDIRSAQIYRSASALYLVKVGTGLPDLPLRRPAQWPFKAASDVR